MNRATGNLKSVWLSVLFVFLYSGRGAATESTVTSPDGRMTVTVVFEKAMGAVTYHVKSGWVTVIEPSPMGISTDMGDFIQGMSLSRVTTRVIDETYALPVGKRSTYVNRANELVWTLTRDQRAVQFRIRAYDDGIAFSYAVDGSGPITLFGETSAFVLSATGPATYWGQNHPNNYGYETMLGRITGDRMSIPVLAELEDQRHFVFMTQAASYGTYIVPHFRRDGRRFYFTFPMDQTGPVQTQLPFQSPWRAAIISPRDVGAIVESTLLENLNPPTEPALVRAAWIKSGRASWDYLAGDRDNPQAWIDFDVQMGWEYHLVDARFEQRFDVPKATRYARDHHVEMIGWGYTPSLNTWEKAEELLGRYAEMGLRGAKLDFFDHHPFVENKRTNDFEDTQASLQMRDTFMEIAADKHLLLEFHGCTLPTGERRRYPHFMTAEAVAGMEKRNPRIENDLTIPYVRNIMGPVSFTVVKFDRSVGSLAYQLGQCVVYEAGLQIYAERHDRLLAFAGVDFLKQVPSAWDETRFLDGYPETHAIFARRKAGSWYIGGITNQACVFNRPLAFLAEGTSYKAWIYRDGDTKTDLVVDEKTVTRNDTLEIPMLQNGGFAARLSPGE